MPIRTEVKAVSLISFMGFVHAWYWWPSVVLQRYQCSVSDLRIATGRRNRIAADPFIHVRDHGTPEILHRQRRLRFLSEQVAGSFLGWKRPGKMLEPGEVIDANIVGNRHIAFPVGVDVNQCRRTPPVLVGSVGEEYFGDYPVYRGAVEKSAGLSCDGVFLGTVSEREDVRGEEY